jgi:3-oxoadipate enol-lactonase
VTGSFESGQASIAYEIIGEGEPVAFLNGVMMTIQSWVLQKAPFTSRYRCLFHDFRGQLLSPAPDEPFTLETHADDLLALLDHLEIRTCHLVGTSYGGEVGMVFALKYPERVSSLAVISSVSHVDAELDGRVEAWASKALEDRDALYRFTLYDNFSAKFLETSGWILEQGEARLRAYPAKYFEDLARLVAAFRQIDLRAALAGLAVPTLLMCGELDALKPVRYSREMAEAIPEAEFLMVPGAGHAVVIEKAAEVNTALLGWIEKNRWNSAGPK